MILDRFQLTDQVAIVTGAGRGIGEGIALAYAEAGAHVVCAARSVDQIEETAAAVRERGRRALAIPCDVLDPAQRQNVVDAALKEFGRLDVLVNNAGGWLPKPALQVEEQEFEESFRFNVTTAFAMTRLCVPRIVETSGRGSVVNISSEAGRQIGPCFVAYGTAKAALSFMTRELAQDFAPKVRVNAIAVGATLTSALESVLNDDLRNTMVGLTPMARLGTVEDVASCALYLAAPASDYVTGEVLGVSGGLTSLNMPLPRAFD